MAFQTHAQSLQHQFDKAFNLIQNGRDEEAILVLDEILKKEPKNPIALFKKGNCFINMGKFKEAINELEKAVASKNDFPEAFELLGNLYAEERNAEKSVANYSKAYEVDKELENRFRYKMEIITILFLVKQYPMAFQHIQDAKTLLPDNFDILFFEAQYYNNMQEYAKAKTILDEIIKDVPVREGNDQYFFEIGFTYHRLGEFQKADGFFKNIIDPEYKGRLRMFAPETYYAMAETYFTVNEFAKAGEMLALVLKINPGFTQAYELQTKLANIKSDKSKLIEIAKGAIKSAEKDGNKPIDKYLDLANLYFQSGNYEQSIEIADEYLKARNMDMQAVFLKASAENKLKKVGDACNLLTRAVKNPSMAPEAKARMFFLLGLAYKNTDKLDLAEESFKNANVGSFKPAAISELDEIFKLRLKAMAK
jgi:tetratricopeptide (TPR) repeat protein